MGLESEVWVNADVDLDANGNNCDVVYKKPVPGDDDKDKKKPVDERPAPLKTSGKRYLQ